MVIIPCSSQGYRDDNLGIFRICRFHVADNNLKKGEVQPHGQTPPNKNRKLTKQFKSQFIYKSIY